ncbi:MAG: hypothetical protein K5760_03130 [Clostridium sp.]|nr:hypothetical protein [Clostridium sp.]
MRDNYIPYVVRIVIGSVIVVSAILLFVDAEAWRILFPVVFFSSSAICTLDGIFLIRRTGGDFRAHLIYMIPIVIGATLFVFGVISVLTIIFR